jgi:hypothetical protein
MFELKIKMSRFLQVVMFFSTLVFSSTLQVFNCVEQTDGSFVLRADPTIKCYEGSWSQYVVLDGILIFLYAVLFPISGLVAFWKLHNDKAKMKLYLQSFLAPYREGCEYWEFVRMFEKIIFFAIRDLSSADRSLKQLLLFAVLVVEHLIDTHVFPFKTAQLNQQSFRWNQLSLLLLTSLFVFESQSSGKDALAAVLILVFLLTLFSQLLTLKDWFNQRKSNRHEQGNNKVQNYSTVVMTAQDVDQQTQK